MGYVQDKFIKYNLEMAWDGSVGRVDMPNRELPKGDFRNLSSDYLRGANFQGSYLAGSIFSWEMMPGARFQGANLSDAIFEGSKLTGAQLQGANLTGAYLSNANLSGANLEGADLQGAIFGRGTDLYGADLRGAKNLGKAINLSKAKNFGMAILPPGFKIRNPAKGSKAREKGKAAEAKRRAREAKEDKLDELYYAEVPEEHAQHVRDKKAYYRALGEQEAILGDVKKLLRRISPKAYAEREAWWEEWDISGRGGEPSSDSYLDEILDYMDTIADLRHRKGSKIRSKSWLRLFKEFRVTPSRSTRDFLTDETSYLHPDEWLAHPRVSNPAGDLIPNKGSPSHAKKDIKRIVKHMISSGQCEQRYGGKHPALLCDTPDGKRKVPYASTPSDPNSGKALAKDLDRLGLDTPPSILGRPVKPKRSRSTGARTQGMRNPGLDMEMATTRPHSTGGRNRKKLSPIEREDSWSRRNREGAEGYDGKDDPSKESITRSDWNKRYGGWKRNQWWEDRWSYNKIRDEIERDSSGTVHMGRADLNWSFLNGENLENAQLPNANLEYVDLMNSNLRGANLGRARLVGTYFKGADLKDADFEGANLDKADLRYAKNLDKAKNLHLAKYLDRAKLPPGFKMPNPAKGSRPKKASAKKASAKKAEPTAKELISKCRDLFEAYKKKPGRARLNAAIKQCDKMKGSKFKTVKEERARCMRGIRREKKRLGMA
jgi:uncharacterized protein YjbI with pentapeptide repeats